MRLAWARGRRPEWFCWAAIALFSLWLKTGFPNTALAYAIHDDALFVHQARLLAAGEWLGPYDSLTLAKGMFFPLFMAAAHALAIPLTIAEHLLYLAVAALTALLVRRRSGERMLALLLFAALAFNPIVWDAELARVVREGIYLSLSLAAVTLLVDVAFPPARARWSVVSRGAAFGLVAGAFWLTREEGPWLLPALATVLLVALPGLLRRSAATRGQRLRPVALGLGASIVVFGGAIVTVSAINWRYYGVFITNEFKAAPFEHAYGALARIRHDQFRRFVVFPKDARERAYRVSPAARELAPVLDGPVGDAWRRMGCFAVPDAECPEIRSSMFMWALRNAAAEAGHYGSATDAMRFYDQLAREIDAACDDGSIPCGPPRATFMPVFRWQYLRDTVDDLPVVARVTLQLASSMLGSAPSAGPRGGIADFVDVVGPVSQAPGVSWFVEGFAASSAGRPNLSLRVRGDAAVRFELSDLPAPDVDAGLPGWTARRFDVRAACPAGVCDIVAAAAGAGEVAAPLDQAHADQTVETPTLKLVIQRAELRDPAALTGRRQAVQLAIARAIAAGYAALAPALTGVGLVGLLLALARWRPRRVPAALLALAAASAAAIAARVLLLAYLEVTSIPASRVLYTSAATPFVIVLAVLGCFCGLRAVWPAGTMSRPA